MENLRYLNRPGQESPLPLLTDAFRIPQIELLGPMYVPVIDKAIRHMTSDRLSSRPIDLNGDPIAVRVGEKKLHSLYDLMDQDNVVGRVHFNMFPHILSGEELVASVKRAIENPKKVASLGYAGGAYYINLINMSDIRPFREIWPVRQ